MQELSIKKLWRTQLGSIYYY